jgi:Tfp pilus assembly protein PilN
MKTLMTVLGLAAVVGVGSAEAGVNPREVRQRARIAHGVRSGELLPREAARLRVEQANIRREEARYRRNDGRLDAWERAELAREQDQANRHIFGQAHDAQDR